MTRALTLALLMAAAPALAQQPGTPAPPSVGPGFGPMPDMRSYATPFLYDAYTKREPRRLERLYSQVQTYSRCAARLNGRLVRSLLTAAAGSSEERADARMLSEKSRGCFGGGVALPVVLLRGSLSEALLGSGAPRHDPDVAATLNLDQLQARYGGARPDGKDAEEAVTLVRQSAECHAMIAGGLVDRLLATDHGSAAERDAFRALHAQAPVCGGATPPARVAPSLRRAALAEARYQWIRHGARAPEWIAAVTVRVPTHA